MKKAFLTLCIGIVIGAFATVSTSALAAIGDSVTAVFADFSYVVNGAPKTLDSPALVYLGKSYIPTTEIANMLNYDVTYRADSRTIEFNNPSPTTATGVTSPMPAPTPSATPTASIAPSPSPDASATPTTSPVPSATPAVSPAPSASPAPVPSPTATPTVTPSPTPAPYTGPVAPGGDNGRLIQCLSTPKDSANYLAYGCSAFGL